MFIGFYLRYSVMRFHPHPRVLDLLVGKELYTTADAAIREVLQNAEDACALQRLKQQDYQPAILIRFSTNGNWVEVLDNGLGMNREAVDLGFTAVGAPKSDIPHVRELLESTDPQRAQQIAAFGIGVLSCFGVAEQIRVDTRMDKDEGLSFVIKDRHEDFEELPASRAETGTTVRLELKPNGPMRAGQVPAAVEQYARHADHVELEDVDAGQRRPMMEKWVEPGPDAGETLSDPVVRRGFLALDPAWDTPGASLRSSVLLCNGGFLVTERESSLLPPSVGGYLGEVDITPGGLTILLTREGFKKDSLWSELGSRLAATWVELIRKKVEHWKALLEEDPSAAEKLAIDRGVIVLGRGPLRDALPTDLRAVVTELIPQVVRLKLWGSDTTRALQEVLSGAKNRGVVYFVRQEVQHKQIQQSIAGATGSLQLTEMTQTRDLRARHLRAKGHVVVSCRDRSYQVELGGGAQVVRVHEADLLTEACQAAGVQCVAVESASPEEVALDAAPEGRLLAGIFGLGSELKFVRLEGSSERVIRDYDGRLLNCSHPEVRELLANLPDIMGNPIRRRLFEIYLDINNYQFTKARESLRTLMLDTSLPDLGQLTAGPLTRDFFKRKVAGLIEQEEEPTAE